MCYNTYITTNIIYNTWFKHIVDFIKMLKRNKSSKILRFSLKRLMLFDLKEIIYTFRFDIYPIKFFPSKWLKDGFVSLHRQVHKNILKRGILSLFKHFSQVSFQKEEERNSQKKCEIWSQ